MITFSVLSLSLVAVLFAPWAIHLTFMNWLAMATASATAATALTAVAALLVFAAFATSCYNMARPLEDGTWQADPRGRASSTQVQLAVVLPILVATTILGAVISRALRRCCMAPGRCGSSHRPSPTPASGRWRLATAHLFKTFDGGREPPLEARRAATPAKRAPDQLASGARGLAQAHRLAVPAGAIGSFVVTATT